MSARVPFSVLTEPVSGGVVAVVVTGDVDADTAPEFERAMVGAVRRNDAFALIVDLSEMAFIDSVGLGALVRAFDRQRRASRGGIAIVSQDQRLVTLLEIAGLDRVLRRFDTREEAIAAL